MFFANLSAAEFLALLGAVSALAVALYLLDRSRRRVSVATLRFWAGTDRPVESSRRRRIRQWPSLLLQLASMALLLLAIAQLRWGSREDSSRDHVLILDTSSWMAGGTGGRSLMEEARQDALQYLQALPAGDRVMVVYTDGLATPATAFEENREIAEAAVRRARAGASALHLGQALAFAQQVQSRSGRQWGEIVLAGGARMAGSEDQPPAAPANLRVLPVKREVENAGIRKLGARRSASEAGLWKVLATVKNYGRAPRVLELRLLFGGAPMGSRQVKLAPGDEREESFEVRSRAAGLLELSLAGRRDGFAGDDRAVLELPQVRILTVAVCTGQPAALRPLIETHPLVEGIFLPPVECPGGRRADVFVFDRFKPPRLPDAPAVYIDPPVELSPVRVSRLAAGVNLERWNASHPVSAGVRTKDVRLAQAKAFALSQGDIAIGESPEGPLVVARDAGRSSAHKLVVFGFDPMGSPMRYELAAPLLFGNILNWMAGDATRDSELFAGSVGTVNVKLEPGADPSTVRVLDERGAGAPFRVEGDRIQFFAGRPGTVRVVAGNRQQVYSLTLPEVADRGWEIPPSVKRGVPAPREAVAGARDLWQWLAALGGLGLLVEWLLFGSVETGRVRRVFRMFRARPSENRKMRRAS